MSSERTDTYWTRIKVTIAVPVVLFVLIIVLVARIPENADVTFGAYPVVYTTIIVWFLSILSAPVILTRSISQDKRDLSADFADVNRRRWVTVALFSVLTAGVYPLWYLYARYRLTKDHTPEGDTSDSAPSPDADSNGQQTSRPAGRNAVIATVSDSLREGWERVRDSRETATTAANNDQGENTDADEADPKRSAEQAVRNGDAAKREGEYERAVDAYDRAVRLYEDAKQDSTEEAPAIDEELADTRAKRRDTEKTRTRIDAVRDPLADAESSFQTAIAQHVQGTAVPTKRDYRQAIAQYEQALSALEESESDVFEEDGITVSVDLGVAPLPEKLTSWQHLSDGERDALSEAGIGTLTELQDAGETVIADLAERAAIDDALADRLRVALRWHGAGGRTFTSRQAVERQRNRAQDGRRMLS